MLENRRRSLNLEIKDPLGLKGTLQSLKQTLKQTPKYKERRIGKAN